MLVVTPVPPLVTASGVVRVKAAAAIVPVNVGEALNTLDPVPVLVVTPVPPLVTGIAAVLVSEVTETAPVNVAPQFTERAVADIKALFLSCTTATVDPPIPNSATALVSLKSFILLYVLVLLQVTLIALLPLVLFMVRQFPGLFVGEFPSER